MYHHMFFHIIISELFCVYYTINLSISSHNLSLRYDFVYYKIKNGRQIKLNFIKYNNLFKQVHLILHTFIPPKFKLNR